MSTNNICFYVEMLDFIWQGDKRYKDLMVRYKQVWSLYKNMQKEMEMLQNDFNRTMQQKLEEKETMMVTRLKMEMKQVCYRMTLTGQCNRNLKKRKRWW